MVIDPAFYMDLAIKEAWKYQFLTYPNPAVGALILDKNEKILALNAHQKAGWPHAELAAISEALFSLGKLHLKLKNSKIDFSQINASELYKHILSNFKGYFKDASIFITLEPCSHTGRTPPCAGLLKALGFKKVFISVKDPYSKGGIKLLKSANICVQVGLCEEQGTWLLKPFLKWRETRFAFFKLALSLNASTQGKITGNKAQLYVHKLREACDVLITGGATLRADRPRLDARLVGHPPDLVVFSRHPLDPSIPALNIKNREVFTSIPPKAKALMYEGGENLLKSFKKDLDFLLILNSNTFNTFPSVSLDLRLKPLHEFHLGEDRATWYALV